MPLILTKSSLWKVICLFRNQMCSSWHKEPQSKQTLDKYLKACKQTHTHSHDENRMRLNHCCVVLVVFLVSVVIGQRQSPRERERELEIWYDAYYCGVISSCTGSVCAEWLNHSTRGPCYLRWFPFFQKYPSFYSIPFASWCLFCGWCFCYWICSNCHRRRSGCPHINNVACVLVVVVEFVLVIHCIFTIFDENIYPVLVQLFRRYVCISAAALFLIS